MYNERLKLDFFFFYSSYVFNVACVGNKKSDPKRLDQNGNACECQYPYCVHAVPKDIAPVGYIMLQP